MSGVTLERCETSWAAAHGQCAVWLNSDTLCDRPYGHYPQTNHRGHDPSGSGRWIDYIEQDGHAVEVDRSVTDSPAGHFVIGTQKETAGGGLR